MSDLKIYQIPVQCSPRSPSRWLKSIFWNDLRTTASTPKNLIFCHDCLLRFSYRCIRPCRASSTLRLLRFDLSECLREKTHGRAV